MTVSRARLLTAAAATMLTVLLTSPSSAQVARFDHDLSLGNQAVSEVRYYGYRRYGYRGYGNRRYGYRGYGYRRYGYRYGYRAAAIGAGVAGAAIGAGVATGAIGGAVAAQATPGYSYGWGTQVTAEVEAYCRSNYSNWDPATRLGLGTNGIWYFCPSYGGGYAAAQVAQ